MSGTTLERRRLLDNEAGGGGGGGVEAPPTPVVHVYPSKGNTLTISSSLSGGGRGQDRSQDRTMTVTNSSYNSWTNPTTSVLVDMTPYDTIYSTKAGSVNSNMVWCYVYCPDTVGATINAKVTYVLSSSLSQQNLSVTTTSSTFISLAISNSFANMYGGTQPNNGHPYLDTANLTCIQVSVTATKDGAISLSKDFTIYIQNTTITLTAPTFTPPGNTSYLGPQSVIINEDPNYSSQSGFYTLWSTGQQSGVPSPNILYTSGTTVQVNSTRYLNAKSFLNLGNGTTVESSMTSQLYTISTPSATLSPPTYSPPPGNFSGSTSVVIQNTNSSPTGIYTTYYTTDGSTPTEFSSIYSTPILITDSTTFKAIVVDSSVTPHNVSSVAIGTYTNQSTYQQNFVSHTVNSDTPSTCGDYSITKTQSGGSPTETYGFCITASNKGSVVYFTTNGTEPTTSSQTLGEGGWYYLTRPNTTLVKYLVVAPNCTDVRGECWILVNKALVRFQYGGYPFLLGPIGNLNWYSRTAGNYSETSSCYIYHNDDQLDPANLSTQTVEVTIDGTVEEMTFLKYTPGSGTTIDSVFTFVYAYSSPVRSWNGMCPYSPFYLMNGYNGTGAALTSAAGQIPLTGPHEIYFSSNEIDTMCCAWMKSLLYVHFEGIPNRVSSCSLKSSLDFGAFVATSISSIDLTPCISMTNVEDRALAGTIYETGTTTYTGLTNILMPMGVTNLGNLIYAKYLSSNTRRPLTVTFYGATVPSASYTTFREFNESSALIGNTSTIVVSDTPYMANVCDYENAWHYHTPRAGTGTGSTTSQNKTDMNIVDQDGLQCGEYPPGSLPTVVTGTPGTPTASSVTISGNSITSDGGYTITQKGVCYSTAHNPVYWNNPINNTGASTTWNAPISGLQPETTYYVRAFARNEAGVGYGEEKSFTTSAQLSVPILSKGHINGDTPDHQFNWNTNEMRIGTKVVSNGGAAITERKVFMKFSSTPLSQSEYPSPTDNTHSASQEHTWTEGDTEFFDFIVDLDNLSNIPQSGYAYFIVYARNSVGWSYRYVVYSVHYNLTSSVIYPTISLSGQLFSENELISGSGIYTYVLANANVTCGSYGDLVVETYVATASGAVPGDSTVVGTPCTNWYDSSTGTLQETINTDGSNYCVYVTPCNIQTNTTYYLRSRVRQSQNSNWVYSDSVPFQRDNAQAGNFGILSMEPFSNSANITAHGTVTPSRPVYGILVADSSTANPTVNNCKSYKYQSITGGTSQTITYETPVNGLTANTSYKCRAFLSDLPPTDSSATVTYSEIAYFMTLPQGSVYTVSSSGTPQTKYRHLDEFNLSFEKVTVELNWFETKYCWGCYSSAISYEEHFQNGWDYIGDSNGNNDGNSRHKRDLFGWGTSSQPHREDDYDAWSTDTTNTYNAYDSQSANLTGPQGCNSNWGWQTYRGFGGAFSSTDVVRADLSVLAVGEATGVTQGDNGTGSYYGQLEGDYGRALTHSEMSYLLFYRTTASGILFCKGRISHSGGTYTNGLILISDGWNGSYTLNNTNNPAAPFSSNTISEANWNSNFKTTARFLPAAGYRKSKTVYKVNTEGWYWLNDSYGSSNNAYCLFFDNSNVLILGKPKYYGLAVRLSSMSIH